MLAVYVLKKNGNQMMMMMRRGKKLWLEIPTASHAVMISSIAG